MIIDEAAQAIEPSALIPLKYNPRTVVMVGDPAQLPATIFSKTAKQAGLGTSLFQRLQASGYPVTMLETQYRMHPLIAEHPSRYFYHGLLKTDQALIDSGKRSKPYHSHPSGLFRPLVWHDVSFGKEKMAGSSIVNIEEARYVCDLYGSLLAEHEGQRTNGKHKREGEEEVGTHHALRNVGIIAPYRAQRQLLASMIKQRFPRCDVEVSTVDGFQGREKDIVLLSACRAPNLYPHTGQSYSTTESIGFLRIGVDSM